MSNPGLTNLKTYWKLNEEAFFRYDAMGNVTLAQTGGVAYAMGHHIFTGNAAEFNASNGERLWTSDPGDHMLAGNFPICFGLWIYVHDLSAESIILSKWDDGGGPEEYTLTIIGSKVSWVINDANSQVHQVTAGTFGVLTPHRWYFVGCYFDSVSNTIGVGVNDVWDTVGVGIYGIDAQNANFIIGSWMPLEDFYDGYMDEVFFYKDRLLNSDEWTWLYNSDYGRRFEDLAQAGPPTIDIITERKIPIIYVYDEALDLLGMIEDYSSLNWSERYNSEGEFELELPLDYASNSLLNFGNFLYIPTSDKLMIVEERKPTRSPTDGKLLVNGRSVESILRRRMQMRTHTWFAPAEYVAYHHVYWSSIGSSFPKRIIDLFEDGSGDPWPPAMESSAEIAEQFDSESIYEIIEIVLKKVSLGFKIIAPNLRDTSSKLYFLVYEGLDRSGNVTFSDIFDNFLDSSFLTTQKGNINTTQVITDDVIYGRTFVWEGGSDESPGGTEPENLNRFEGRLETSIDRQEEPESESTSRVLTKPSLGVVGQNNLVAIGITTTPVMELKTEEASAPLTDKEVLDIIEARGEEVIKENNPIAIFDGDVDARRQFVIEEDFFLGDIVQVTAHGRSDKARVIEVVKSYSVEGERIYIAFDFEV